MKKTILSAMMFAALFASCSSNEDFEGYGKIAVNVDNDLTVGTVQTREATTVSGTDELNKYTYTVSRTSSTSTWSGDYSYITGANFAAGTDYYLEAENCTAAAAKTANSNYGQLRVYGKTANAFSITAGQTTSVSLTCTVANSKVSVIRDNSLSSYFSACTINVGDGTNDGQRMLEFGEESIGYFDAGVALKYSISATLTSGSTVTYAGTVNLKNADSSTNVTEAAKWYKITVKASPTNGTIGISLSVDSSTTDVTTDVDIDPYGGTASN